MAVRTKTVGGRVAELLRRKRPMSYDAIASKVREETGSHTTARSVASIASSLRAAGVDLPDRRTQGSLHEGAAAL